MFGKYTQIGLSFKYSCNKNCTIPYFINLICNRAHFAVLGPTSLVIRQIWMTTEIKHKNNPRSSECHLPSF